MDAPPGAAGLSCRGLSCGPRCDAPPAATTEEPEASDHLVSHSSSSWRRRSSWPGTGGTAADAAVSAGSSAVVGAAGSAGRPKPAAPGRPVVPAASAEAAALPPESAPSVRVRSAPDSPDGLDALLRFSNHHTTPMMTMIRMIQKTKSMAGPSVRMARCLFLTLRPAATTVQIDGSGCCAARGWKTPVSQRPAGRAPNDSSHYARWQSMIRHRISGFWY